MLKKPSYVFHSFARRTSSASDSTTRAVDKTADCNVSVGTRPSLQGLGLTVPPVVSINDPSAVADMSRAATGTDEVLRAIESVRSMDLTAVSRKKEKERRAKRWWSILRSNVLPHRLQKEVADMVAITKRKKTTLKAIKIKDLSIDGSMEEDVHHVVSRAIYSIIFILLPVLYSLLYSLFKSQSPYP